MNWRALGIVAVAVATLLPGARAEDTWLAPERFAATPGAVLRLDLTKADSFATLQTTIAAEEVARVLGRLGGAELTVGATEATEQTLRFPVTLTRPGVMVWGVELKPRERELTEEKIEAYFRAIHAGDELREQWAARPEPKKWRERMVRTAKTFVRVGEPAADDRTWAEPLGLGLEIVPEREPTMLKEGEALPVRVWRDGRPLAGFVIGYVSAGETREHVAVTDAEGRASAVLDGRGSWLVHGTNLRRITDTPQREWESERATMVVEVR